MAINRTGIFGGGTTRGLAVYPGTADASFGSGPADLTDSAERLGPVVGFGKIVDVADSQQMSRPSNMPTSGMGLTGLRERVALADGTFQAGENASGDFILRAALPWRA